MKTSRIPGFYTQTISQRLDSLAQACGLSQEELSTFQHLAGLSLDQANYMVENAIGTFSLPLGLGLNFIINGREVVVPMAIEEPSVVAGASFMAKLARSTGGFVANTTPPEMIGQMQLLDINNLAAARTALLEHKDELLQEAGQIDPVLNKLGGGARNLEIRSIESSPIGPFLVIHLIYDVRDAMGANAVNTACERLAPRIEALTGGRVHLRILSNLADRRLARASCTIPPTELAFDAYSGEQVRDGIIEAWAFAVSDPYRATTHNKGIMNGVDAVVIATGNDWRAIEAGAHAYAAHSGRYTSLSTWGKDDDGNLAGSLEMPMAVGIVGGATRVNPAAITALKLMQVTSAAQLAEIIVSVGLAQNLAALRALATEGIQRGHMTLHARQVAIAAGASGAAIEKISAQLVAEKSVRIDRAEEILKGMLSNHD
ncbi:MAG: hydroxymethylglutaryl-CoA reductase, degradative [Chloroflexi bacterium GWB2_49_20]|nr:MAG: hydroxymethylglutaryl-CoA reductase, degradative [Chloroflexi bacterium GWB2_49_20]OGN77992.1 MAG: hydroxymethylglutaryl-CoA reductase, degradative [Chloroflexi bacterium GWC2_49_37]OGN85030.1 MAG: hydroxymethylglutaryl-CoA reductase, degradative [Chloroflexi bacterium GWD2_49_16]HBG74934.1 hydroxymethylglutaryl-CoA reductase, degradative [Anaerolineae bacterium]HCC78342.1 hydroxymethylglutaryl-CoA reductase, degradative [Anaerolineae bacterium]